MLQKLRRPNLKWPNIAREHILSVPLMSLINKDVKDQI